MWYNMLHAPSRPDLCCVWEVRLFERWVIRRMCSQFFHFLHSQDRVPRGSQRNISRILVSVSQPIEDVSLCFGSAAISVGRALVFNGLVLISNVQEGLLVSCGDYIKSPFFLREVIVTLHRKATIVIVLELAMPVERTSIVIHANTATVVGRCDEAVMTGIMSEERAPALWIWFPHEPVRVRIRLCLYSAIRVCVP